MSDEKQLSIDIINNGWKKDCVINRDDAGNEAIKIPMLMSKYLSLVNYVSIKLKKIKLEYDELYKNRWLFYSGKLSDEEIEELGWTEEYYELSHVKILKTDMSIYLNGDKVLKNYKLEMNKWVEMEDTLDAIMKSISQRSFYIKNYIDWQKFVNGVQ